jgi:hypothetical protein
MALNSIRPRRPMPFGVRTPGLPSHPAVPPAVPDHIIGGVKPPAMVPPAIMPTNGRGL